MESRPQHAAATPVSLLMLPVDSVLSLAQQTSSTTTPLETVNPAELESDLVLMESYLA